MNQYINRIKRVKFVNGAIFETELNFRYAAPDSSQYTEAYRGEGGIFVMTVIRHNSQLWPSNLRGKSFSTSFTAFNAFNAFNTKVM